MKNNYVPEWDFNFDYYVFNLLEDGYKIGYMSDDLNYSLWNSIHELYPDDIEFKNGVKNYIKYCKNNHIDKKYLDDKTNLDTPNIMPMFSKNDRERQEYLPWKWIENKRYEGSDVLYIIIIYDKTLHNV